MSTQSPALTIQTGTLFASGDTSTFTGTGGPYGFDSFTNQFGGVISSAGLASEPFADTVYEVSEGDEVTFVIAVQDTTPGTPAYDVRMRSLMPEGFIVPPEGMNLSLIDGAGHALAFTGDLFSSPGLRITPALAGYDANSGGNVALVTYTLQAASDLPGPYATVIDTATINHFAGTSGGADLSVDATASTTLVTAAISPIVSTPMDVTAVAKGQTVTFDVTIPVPKGTLQDLRLDAVLPDGPASLLLVSAQVVGTGSRLTLGTPQIAGGSILFGTVTSAGADASAMDANTATSLVVRLVVQADGTASGNATLDAVVSTLDRSGTGSRWTADIGSSVGVVVPPDGSIITGVATTQIATSSMSIRPFAAVQITDDDPEGIGTLVVTVQDAVLGTLTAGALGTVQNGGSTLYAIGPIAALQDAARHLVFTASQAGTARFNLTVVNTGGGVVQNTDTAISLAPSIDSVHRLTHGAPSTDVTFQTTNTDGAVTIVAGEKYSGPVNYIQAQYIYDGAQPVSIAAEASGVYIRNISATASISLLAGRNVVDAGTGSNFLIGGSGEDSFFIDARGATPAWSTIANFHAGDVTTIFGYQPGTSALSWATDAGAVGSTGRTLSLDIAGQGYTGATLTFAGIDQAASDRFVVTSGQSSGVGYLTITA